MPIPTRSGREPPIVTEAKSKTPSARTYQRTASSVVPATTAKATAKSHQRAVSSLIQQPQASLTDQAVSSLQRQPATAVKLSHSTIPVGITGRSISKPSSTPATSVVKHAIEKPQFSTYQQHFSPKKPLKSTLTTDPLLSREASTKDHENAETSRIRDELLQLQLMHVTSNRVVHQFEATSKMRLRSKLDGLKHRSDSLKELEKQRRQWINHTALENWLNENSQNTGDKLRLLETCIGDIDSLTFGGGRLSKTLAQFQKWFEDMIFAMDTRESASQGPTESLMFTKVLDESWKSNVASIQRKLEQSRETLSVLGLTSGNKAAIHLILSKYKALVENLLEELKTCISIYSIVLAQEQSWIVTASEKLVDEQLSRPPETSIASRASAWES